MGKRAFESTLRRLLPKAARPHSNCAPCSVVVHTLSGRLRRQPRESHPQATCKPVTREVIARRARHALVFSSCFARILLVFSAGALHFGAAASPRAWVPLTAPGCPLFKRHRNFPCFRRPTTIPQRPSAGAPSPRSSAVVSWCENAFVYRRRERKQAKTASEYWYAFSWFGAR